MPKRNVFFFLTVLIFATTIAVNFGYAAETKTSEKPPDFFLYESIVLMPITHARPELNEPPGAPGWTAIVLYYIGLWENFQKQFPQSPLIPQTNIRIAERCLMIDKEDPNYNQYRQKGLKILNDAIARYPDIPYYSYLGEDAYGRYFGYEGDTVASYGLELRIWLFPDTRKQDLKTMKRLFPNTPAAKRMFQEFGEPK